MTVEHNRVATAANSGICLETIGGEARLTLCRPELGNALRIEDIVAATRAIEEAGRMPGVKVLRLYAQGASFCVGRAAEAGARPSLAPESIRGGLVQPILDLYRAIHLLDIISVAQVQGDAHGLGCALMAACDLAVAASSAMFSLPEMHKDLPPTLALSAVLPNVHPKAAASLVLAARTLDAREALAVGLISEMVEASALQQRVDEIVTHTVARHPVAIKAVKRYLRAAGTPTYHTNAELAASLLSSAMSDIRADIQKSTNT
ncbi:Hydroxycinnamoyl-CoA hydratase-lyase [Variovorax sp. PBS-H4]|uniref:enoyl-CoA hydratase/isomerase family protein n=1 Tax=Variovorax sp. PBS-H4 TaxID=434008 RepID=UPI001316D004|nr:enoyl-CoA hydratase/isomerase family protein [Variovorax sp. PBS-H4]VTU34412.1 Hydroxycinnamoyl-CoA hydratase-lyase [Variovorax sp. PBS-H4]